MNILSIAHNHPAFHPGGAEILAWDLFRSFAAWPGVTSSFRAAIDPRYRTAHPGPSIQARPGEDNVFLYRGPGFDPIDRKSVVEGKSVSVRVNLGGRLIIKNKNR